MDAQPRAAPSDALLSPSHERQEEAPKGLLQNLSSRGHHVHQKIPIVRALPAPAVAIILLLILINAATWVAVGIVLHFHGALAGTAVLAWTLGLRHALDADHISAIDLMTRRLVASNQRPVTVGTYFSLGHSTCPGNAQLAFDKSRAATPERKKEMHLVKQPTSFPIMSDPHTPPQSSHTPPPSIVIITTVVVAATAAAISKRFATFSRIGGIIGSSISSAFLLTLGAANAYLLFLLLRQIRRLSRQNSTSAGHPDGTPFKIEGGGCLFWVLKRMFHLIDRPWKMYPLGILFGLGFDTSSQIALLGLSSLQSTTGTSIWLILLLPLLFTAGMVLLDTADGALMLTLYCAAMAPSGGADGGSAPGLPRHLPLLYTNVLLTGLTVLIALVIGVLQVLGLAESVLEARPGGESGAATGPFWAGVRAVQDRYDVVGAVICGVFAAVGVLGFWLYPIWREWVLSGRGGGQERGEEVGGLGG